MEKEDTLLKQLAESSVALQKTSLNLAEKTSDLTKRIDKLVSLFEEASKHVGDVENREDRVKVLSEKLEALLDQNKEIAKGLILLDKYIRGKNEFENLRPKILRNI